MNKSDVWSQSDTQLVCFIYHSEVMNMYTLVEI